jgi:putative radical SAM enzyme (TIGR03279 family)
MVRVEAVHPESLGAELGLQPGTQLLNVNGRKLEDFLDWEFLTADDQFTLLAEQPDGELIEYDVERPEGLPFGVVLEPPRIRRCANRCDFCFVDGLPEGLRDVLYIRDDDYRLSFRYGNFATLTNLKQKDIDRIFEYRLSPLYVSVHATDPVVRRRLLRNPRAPDIIPQLKMFAKGGIEFHTQVVLQPGVNDGPVLQQTLDELYALGPGVRSAAVVPVGLTEFSKHDLVREPTRDECREALAIVNAMTRRAMTERGTPWVHGSDDLYLVAERDLPPADAYEGFEQVENGVGSVRYLQRQIEQARQDMPDLTGQRIAVLTGSAMGRLMPQVLEGLSRATHARYELLPLENDLFGHTVTTAGLLPGRAFAKALAGRSDLALALLPAEAVNDNGLFMDDMTVAELTAKAPCEIRFSYHFTDALTVESPA